MARNQEKAQSMLYRFREAQAAELGLAANKQQRRPRLASSVSSLRDCEKWRGEILREISRKVSKIQDFGLTDFEVRDLNDEINKLLREKGHWETQILALGGANYKRGVPKMLDDSGREVPGTRGYKYFGRAKDLPGVKELFSRTQEQEDEAESFRSRKYQRFANLPPVYFGDEDEDDGALLEYEQQEEERLWKEGYRSVLESLEMDVDDAEIPDIPRPKAKSLKEIREASGGAIPTAAHSTAPLVASTSAASSSATATAAAAAATTTATEDQPTSSEATGTKRRQPTAAAAKRQKGEDGEAVSVPAPSEPTSATQDGDEEMQVEPTAPAVGTAATTGPATADNTDQFKALYYSVLDPAELEMPRVPDRAETEKMILQAKKKALRDEYIGAK